jgi:hypothetical protein
MEEPLLRREYWLKILLVCPDNCTYLDICTSVIIYALYIDSTVGLEYDTYITTSDTTISSSVN